MKLFLQILAIIGSYASIYGFYGPYTNFNEASTLELFLFCLGSILLIILIIYSFFDYFKNKSKIFRNKTSRYKFLEEWLKNGDRVVICTRDMSWGEDTRFKDLLIKKAERGDLNICLHENSAFTEELNKKGAHVYTYGQLGIDTPSTRFTIAHYEKESSSVAVSQELKDKKSTVHIYNNSDLSFAIIKDYINLIIRLSENHNKGLNNG